MSVARPPTVRTLSLCAGAAGLDLGVERVLGGAVPIGYVEHEASSASLLAARMAEGALPQAPVWSDLRTFDGRRYRGLVDLVVAGVPCQAASTAGRRRGDADERWLWGEAMRVIAECDASCVFFENVPGLLSVELDAVCDLGRPALAEGGDAVTLRGLGSVLGDLAQGGFDAEWTSLRASDVGAPHRRERVFIFAWQRERHGIWREWLGDADRGPGGDAKWRSRDGSPPAGTGAAVGDPGHHDERPRHPGGLRAAAGGADPEGLQRERGGDPAGDPGADVADASDDGCCGRSAAYHGDRSDAPGDEPDRRDPAVPDADGGGRGQAVRVKRLTRGRAVPLSVRADRGVADADGGGRRQGDGQRHLAGRGTEPDGGGEKRVADAHDPERRAQAAGGDLGDGDDAGRREAADPAGAHGQVMADARSEGREVGRRVGGDVGPERPAPQRDRAALGTFPPGPADHERWRRILAERPDLAPAIAPPQSRLRGVVDGVAGGVDGALAEYAWVAVASRASRLRACGNGVVPEQAAEALWELLEAAEDV